MDLFVFITIVIVVSGILGPLAKGLGRRIGKGGDSPELQVLRQALAEAEQRLTETERRLAMAEERLDFQENLLTKRATHRVLSDGA